MEHEWPGDVTRAGDGDVNLVFFMVKTLAILFVGYNMLSNQFSEGAKGIGNQPIWLFYSGPDMYVKMDLECLPVLKRIIKSDTTCET